MKGLALVAAIWLGATASVAGAATSDRVARFDQLDSNADGKLSRAEASTYTDLKQKFDQLDVNKDGFLSRDELTAKRRSFCAVSDDQGPAAKAQSQSSGHTAFVTQ